jgi:hypothetical protein
MKIRKLKVNNGNRKGAMQTARFKILIRFALALVLGTTALSVYGQNYTIDWHKIAGGGGTSAGGTYQLNGTVGQSDASGALSGGNYSVTGGFWSLISVVQTPGMPPLYISSSGNTVTVYWQNVSGCALQQNGNCMAPTGWAACPYSPTTSNGTNYVNIPCTGGNLFFRLCKQ